MFGDNLVQFGPVGISAAQFGFRILPTDPPDDGLSADTPRIDVYEGDIACGGSSKSRVLTTFFAMLVSDNPSDFLTAGVNNAQETLLNGGEYYLR